MNFTDVWIETSGSSVPAVTDTIGAGGGGGGGGGTILVDCDSVYNSCTECFIFAALGGHGGDIDGPLGSNNPCRGPGGGGGGGKVLYANFNASGYAYVNRGGGGVVFYGSSSCSGVNSVSYGAQWGVSGLVQTPVSVIEASFPR